MEAFYKLIKDNNIKIKIKDNDIVNYIKVSDYNSVDIHKLKRYFEEKYYDVSYIDDIVKHLIEEQIVIEKDGVLNIVLPKLSEELDKISNKNNHKDMLIRRLQGETLANIGEEYGVTRERIRQIVQKEINRINRVDEEKYVSFITEYNIDIDLFKELFNENEITYYFLKEKYKSGDKDPYELFYDSRTTSEQIETLRKRYNLIHIYNEDVVADPLAIIIAILKNESKSLQYDELMDKYNNIIATNGIDMSQLSKSDMRNIEARIDRNNYILNTIGNGYRYFNILELDDYYISELRKLLNTEAGAYSAELFFNNNKSLMNELDIRNEYELHNLLKKLFKNKLDDVNFSRMPDVFINCNDKLKFIEEKIQEMSPISIPEFLEYMYNNYGHKCASLNSLILSNFNDYVSGNSLICNMEMFTEKQEAFMREALTDDLYAISTIKELITEEFNVNDFRLINKANMQNLGFRLRENYIIREEVGTLELYMDSLILYSDYFEPSDEMQKIGSSYYSYLYRFINDRKIFKVSQNKYITIRKLNQMGILKEDIDSYLDKISAFIKNDEFFNLYSLRQGLNIDFSIGDFTTEFYESLIYSIDKVKTLRVDNNVLFIRTEEAVSREKFIETFITDDKVYIKSIKENILKKYNIELSNYFIRQIINKQKYYVDSTSECVYKSKELFDKDLKKWDILQFLD